MDLMTDTLIKIRPKPKRKSNVDFTREVIDGDGKTLSPSDVDPIDLNRFWSKVDKESASEFRGSKCWLWTRGLNDSGYGAFNVRGRRSPIGAHRYSWELAGNTLTPGYTLDHLCRIRACVNPEHLEEVTRAENVRRMHEFWRSLRDCTCGCTCGARQ